MCICYLIPKLWEENCIHPRAGEMGQTTHRAQLSQLMLLTGKRLGCALFLCTVLPNQLINAELLQIHQAHSWEYP